MNGPVFVSLYARHVDQEKSERNSRGRGAHGKDDDANGPAVDELVIPLIIFRLIDDFRRKVTWRPTHRLHDTQRTVSFAKHQGEAKRDKP
jgi:hypothetical protein